MNVLRYNLLAFCHPVVCEDGQEHCECANNACWCTAGYESSGDKKTCRGTLNYSLSNRHSRHNIDYNVDYNVTANCFVELTGWISTSC